MIGRTNKLERLHKMITKTASSLAVFGGVVLCCVVVMTLLSVVGREISGLAQSPATEEQFPLFTNIVAKLGIQSITGDYEITSAVIAFIVFSFLPICQLSSGHAVIDVFTLKLPMFFQRLITCFWEIVLTIFIIIICVQLFDGLLAKYQFKETTFLLRFPVWWAYAASFFSACVAGLVACYCSVLCIMEVVTQRSLITAVHGDEV